MLRELSWAPRQIRGAAVEGSEFGAFYNEQWADVAGFCGALVGSATTGEDLAQEAFTRLCARWRFVNEPRPYVFRIARNLAVRHRKQMATEVLVDLTPDAPAADGVDPTVLDAVRALPERLSVVILLHYFADLPIAEVAAVLRRPVGSVKRQMNEARALLAATIGAGHE